METNPQITSSPAKHKISWKELYRRHELRTLFSAKFPQAFFPKGSPKKPLKIGIFEDIAAAYPDVPLWQIALVLRDYCTGPSYYAAVARGGYRIDLNGNPAQAITPEAMAKAAEALRLFPINVQKRWEVPTTQ